MAPPIAHIKSFLAQEEAATTVEYGLLVALVAITCLAAVRYLGFSVRRPFLRLYLFLLFGDNSF